MFANFLFIDPEALEQRAQDSRAWAVILLKTGAVPEFFKSFCVFRG